MHFLQVSKNQIANQARDKLAIAETFLVSDTLTLRFSLRQFRDAKRTAFIHSAFIWCCGHGVAFATIAGSQNAPAVT